MMEPREVTFGIAGVITLLIAAWKAAEYEIWMSIGLLPLFLITFLMPTHVVFRVMYAMLGVGCSIYGAIVIGEEWIVYVIGFMYCSTALVK